MTRGKPPEAPEAPGASPEEPPAPREGRRREDAYDFDGMSSAAEAVSDTPEEAKELLNFAKPTSMMTREEQIVMLAKIVRDNLRAQHAHTEELQRTNDIMVARDKRVIWLIQHTGKCVADFFRALQSPKLLLPVVAIIAFVALVAVGQGDRALDIAESFIEHYAGVDVHGHADAERRSKRRAEPAPDAAPSLAVPSSMPAPSVDFVAPMSP